MASVVPEGVNIGKLTASSPTELLPSRLCPMARDAKRMLAAPLRLQRHLA